MCGDARQRSTGARSSGRRGARVHERTIQTSRSGRYSTKLRRGGWKRVWERGCYAGSHKAARSTTNALYHIAAVAIQRGAGCPCLAYASSLPRPFIAFLRAAVRLVLVVSRPIAAVSHVCACDNRGLLSTPRTGPVAGIGDACRKRATARQRASAPGLGLDHRPIPGRPVGPASASIDRCCCTSRGYRLASVGPTASAAPGWAGIL